MGVRRRFEKKEKKCVAGMCVGKAIFSFLWVCVCVIFSTFIGTSFIYVGRT